MSIRFFIFLLFFSAAALHAQPSNLMAKAETAKLPDSLGKIVRVIVRGAVNKGSVVELFSMKKKSLGKGTVNEKGFADITPKLNDSLFFVSVTSEGNGSVQLPDTLHFSKRYIRITTTFCYAWHTEIFPPRNPTDDSLFFLVKGAFSVGCVLEVYSEAGKLYKKITTDSAGTAQLDFPKKLGAPKLKMILPNGIRLNLETLYFSRGELVMIGIDDNRKLESKK